MAAVVVVIAAVLLVVLLLLLLLVFTTGVVAIFEFCNLRSSWPMVFSSRVKYEINMGVVERLIGWGVITSLFSLSWHTMSNCLKLFIYHS